MAIEKITKTAELNHLDVVEFRNGNRYIVRDNGKRKKLTGGITSPYDWSMISKEYFTDDLHTITETNSYHVDIVKIYRNSSNLDLKTIIERMKNNDIESDFDIIFDRDNHIRIETTIEDLRLDYNVPDNCTFEFVVGEVVISDEI